MILGSSKIWGNRLGLIPSEGNGQSRLAGRFGSSTPNDAELSRVYGYWPVRDGWIDGDIAGAQFRDAVPVTAPNSLDPGFDEFMRIQRRNSYLQIASTVAVGIIAGVALLGVFASKR